MISHFGCTLTYLFQCLNVPPSVPIPPSCGISGGVSSKFPPSSLVYNGSNKYSLPITSVSGISNKYLPSLVSEAVAEINTSPHWCQ